MNKPEQPVTPERLMQMVWGFAPPLMIEAAIRHRYFDVLDASSKSAEQVAQETGTSLRGARAILNGLVGFQLLTKERDQYAVTPESSAFLVTTKPSFQGGLFRHVSRQLIGNWLNLTEVVETGKPVRAVNQEGTGAEFFQELVRDIFPLSYRAAQTLGEHLAVPQASGPIRVLDLAAGSGVWGIALAQQSSQVRVTAVDWQDVLPVTRQMAERFDVAGRFTFTGGDLLEADFGSDHQIATLGHILHSEGPEKSRRLLRKTFDALAPGGTIAIAEFTPNADRTGPPGALIFAVNMLVNTDDGDTYPFAEVSGWLKEAGFVNARELDAPAPAPLILATRPA